MQEISNQKTFIGALYAEDLIEFFMNNYMIAWQRPYGISTSLNGVPVLFTEEIGRAAIDISHTYYYRQSVGVSELREYFHDKINFRRYVYSKVIECLQRPSEDKFFHMSAYAGEVAVFCQLENVPYLHQQLISTIQNVVCHYFDIHLEITRLYLKNLAKKLNDARIRRLFSDVDATLTNQSFQNETPISNTEAFPAENSYNSHQYTTPSVVLDPIHAVDVNNVSQLQSFVHLDAVNSLPEASFSHPSSYTSIPVPETMTSGCRHQNVLSTQSIPTSSPVHPLEWSYHQQVPGYCPSPIVPSGMYQPTVESEFNASHVQQNFVSSSVNDPEFTSSFNTVNDTNSTEHTSTENSNGNVSAMDCPRSNSKFQALNVYAPDFVPSSKKPSVDSFKTKVSETSCKNGENTISISNGTHSEPN